MKFNNIDSPKGKIDLILAGMFIIVVSIVFYKSLKLETSFSTYSKHIEAIDNLYAANNNLNKILLKKARFINYDNTVMSEKNFEKNLDLLEKSHTFSNRKIEETLKKLKSRYLEKKAYIERYKSYNATLLSSLIYVLDTQSTLNENEAKIIYKEILDLIKLFADVDLDFDIIKNDISTIDKYPKNTLPKKVMLLHEHIKALIKQLNYLNAISNKITSINISQELDRLDSLKKQTFSTYLNNIKQSILILSIVSIILLVAFIYRYFIFLKVAKQLSTFAFAIENSDNVVLITDKNRIITYVNDAFTKNTGYTKEEVLGKNPRILKSGLLPQSVYEEMNVLLDKGEKWTGEFVNKAKDGSIFYEKASITPMFMDEKLIGYLAIKLNITDYIEQKNKITFLAIHDQLTELKNRHAFNSEIKQLLAKNDAKLAVMFLDIDDFKIINDSLGHDVGDKLLKYFSDKLTHNLNKEDRIYRFGGDEFVIIITKNVTDKNVTAIAQRIVSFAKKPFVIDGEEIHISTSLGIAMYPNDTKDINTLLRYADVAMYGAKTSGKNSYRFYTENFSKELQLRIDIEQELKGALKRDEFYIVYQPKYSLKDKKIVSLEVLIRWRNKKLGQVGPSLFIPIAEKMDIINDITYFVFIQMCEDFKELKSALKDLANISINVSMAQLNDIDLVKYFKMYDITSNDIVIEITETALMQNVEQSIRTLVKFKEIGFKISLDDFGTGYSSLNYLIKLPINNLKIDKSFVDVMFDGKKELDMIKAIVSICKNFGFKSVAEGIETLEQETTLQELGVDLGQGYHFSKPLLKEELLARFSSSS